MAARREPAPSSAVVLTTKVDGVQRSSSNSTPGLLVRGRTRGEGRLTMRATVTRSHVGSDIGVFSKKTEGGNNHTRHRHGVPRRRIHTGMEGGNEERIHGSSLWAQGVGDTGAVSLPRMRDAAR